MWDDSTRTLKIKTTFFEELNVRATIIKGNKTLPQPGDVATLLNDFFKSILISQLEFRFPMIFCQITRQKMHKEQRFLGSVSDNLSGSTKLIPTLTKLVNDDTKSLSVYQILNANKVKLDLNIIEQDFKDN